METQTIYIGTSEKIWREFRDLNGDLSSPTSPNVIIYNPNGVLYSSGTPTLYSTGLCYFGLTVSATATPGIYNAWWTGTIGTTLLSMDVPQYINVTYKPFDLTDSTGLIRQVRMNVGDNDPDNYKYTPNDIIHYIIYAVENINSKYDLGYIATIDSTGVLTFNATLTQLAKTLYGMQAIFLIMSSELNYIQSNVGSFTVGDISVNLSSGTSVKKSVVDSLRKDIDDVIYAAIISGQEAACVALDTHFNAGRPWLTGWRRG